MSALFSESGSLRGILDASARALERIYRDSAGEPAATQSRTTRWLAADRWFIQAQIEELDAALSKEFCRKLNRTRLPLAGPQPRVYRTIAETLGCLVSSPLGPQALGKLLTTPALAELFAPQRLGSSLTLAELWAVPPVVKLVLIESIARSVTDWPLDSERCECEVRSAMECLHSLARIRWSSLIESISLVHHILSQDPYGVYLKMEFDSRDLYRHAVENLALESGKSEEYVAKWAVALAWEASREEGRERECDAGYYLIGPGIRQLRRRAGLGTSFGNRLRQLALAAPNVTYAGGIAVLTALFTLALFRWAGPLPWWWIALLAPPASAPAIAVVNLTINLVLRRRRMPRLDFSQGVPEEHRTFVVIPTLLLSRASVERVLERLEIHYLGNRDPNLAFGLLTDFPDASAPAASDHALVEAARRGIERLNRRHPEHGNAPFYLFHRQQEWNESQRAWIGRERKRGKLEDFNRLLLGLDDSFSVKVGDLSILPTIRYVLTLDTDTQLPRGAACKLIGTLAHPLQRPVLDSRSHLTAEGYAILQPMVKTSLESAGRSRFARILCGQTGLDPYTTAIADVYQDLYGRASYAGKGIYDVRAFHEALDGRFPGNTLLSHDLLEGEYASTGLVTDIDVIEDHPHSYESYAQRRHRWVRGDWQILDWLLPRVPVGPGNCVPNPLPLVSRWKIADNLRRSLFEISLLVWFAAGWFLGPGSSTRIAFGGFCILVFSAYAHFGATIITLPSARFWRGHFREGAIALWRAHQEAFLMLVLLPLQALVAADAIVRTLVRRFITHRNLLEWHSMEQVEAAADGSLWNRSSGFLFAGLVLAASCGILLRTTELPIALGLTLLWTFSPAVARFVKSAPWRPPRQQPGDVEFLRDLSLRTWRYFADFSRPKNHWLVPDNVQEEPETIAHRASPTNIGLQLASNVAAFDFGYITHAELAGRLEDLLDTLAKMARHRGHLFNWYDTRSLAALPPSYISTVDSGNLAAALIAVKQACEGISRQPLIEASVLDGIRDHCLRLRRLLPFSARRTPAIQILDTLLRLLEARPRNLFAWEHLLADILLRVEELNRCLEAICGEFGDSGRAPADEFCYWRSALTYRVRAARANLCSLAPWLRDPCKAALMERAENPQFEDLLSVLAPIPELGALPRVYDAVGYTIEQFLASEAFVAATLRDWLGQLRQDTDLARARARALLNALSRSADSASRFALAMDFAFLFDPDRDLLRIGYNTASGALDDSYYDLLASEARTAVFFAVAKGDVPRETWFRLGRKVAAFKGHRTLLSWSGTMFEYLMPSLFMKTFAPTLLGESLTGVVEVQKAYARERKVPWGISESSCTSRNGDLHYKYHAFGIPAVSLSRMAPQNLVVAPYASMLALMIDRQPAAQNLRSMASRGWTGRYGFFDAVEFQTGDSTSRESETVVRSFMAHHQGMGLLALANALLDNLMQKRFHAEPIVAATELLLQERVPIFFGAFEEQKAPAILRV